MIKRYRWDKAKGAFVDKATGQEIEDRHPNAICKPYVVSDCPAYFSVATNRWVDGRRARRDDLARSGCVPWEPDSKRGDPKGISNPRIAKKYGLPISEEAANRPRAKRIDPLADVALKP